MKLKEKLTEKGEKFDAAYKDIEKEFVKVKKEYQDEIADDEEIEELINSPEMLMLKGIFDILAKSFDELLKTTKDQYEDTLKAATAKENNYEEKLEEYLDGISTLPQQLDVVLQQTVAMKDDLSKAIFMPGMEKTLNHILKTTVDFAYDTADNCQEFADIIDKNLSNDCELEK